jgi:hypothetical protein
MYNTCELGVFTYPNIHRTQPCNTRNDELPGHFEVEIECKPGG